MKRDFGMNHILGWAAFVGLILCCSYYWLRRSTWRNYFKAKNILNSHCILGIISIIPAGYHTVWNIIKDHKGSLGYICLAAMLYVNISGTITQYYKRVSVEGENRGFWRGSHQIATVVLVVVLIAHIMVYVIMS